MAPLVQDDWSDSDDEVLSEVETSVLLGVPDGPITTASDLTDAAVSRIGGHPAFLPSNEPPFSSSHCKSCFQPMELLVQMWCPFEDSPMDRALYIWGCAKGACQGKQGSVRAWRGLRYNDKYAAKLEKKLARRREREQAKVEADAQHKKQASQPNPFALQVNSASNPFGLGAQIFGNASPAPTPQQEHELEASDTESDSGASSEESLLTAMASTTLEESPWVSAPSYPPLYLSTSSEYVLPPPKSKLPADTHVEDPNEGDRKGSKDFSWAFEGYENSMNVDEVFERFTQRVGYEGEQCVRYDLKGVPLPFASDKVFDSLFPKPPSPPLPVTKPDFKVVHAQKRVYDSSAIPSCTFCKSTRVFECQLMPNLINILRVTEDDKVKKLSDEERRKVVEQALKEKVGMEWGTSLIFSCSKDCCVGEDGAFEGRECWREEYVLTQWDV